METYNLIKEILAEILDAEPGEIMPETYLFRDLGVESIDLMEFAVTLNDQLGTEINEDTVFLRFLREHLAEAEQIGADKADFIAEKFSFLSQERIREILEDLDGGPVLKVKDIVTYIGTL